MTNYFYDLKKINKVLKNEWINLNPSKTNIFNDLSIYKRLSYIEYHLPKIYNNEESLRELLTCFKYIEFIYNKIFNNEPIKIISLQKIIIKCYDMIQFLLAKNNIIETFKIILSGSKQFNHLIFGKNDDDFIKHIKCSISYEQFLKTFKVRCNIFKNTSDYKKEKNKAKKIQKFFENINKNLNNKNIAEIIKIKIENTNQIFKMYHLINNVIPTIEKNIKEYIKHSNEIKLFSYNGFSKSLNLLFNIMEHKY
jgi:hypothetical protein